MSPSNPRLADPDASREFYDERFAQGYMDEWPPEKRQRVFEIVAGLGLPHEGDALDFGCGNGVFTAVLREALPGWRIYGTDLSAVALAHAREAVPSGEFLELPDAARTGRRFDFVFTHHVLEHVYDLDAAWRQIVGLLKPGSAMLHILPCGNPGSLEYRISRLTDGGFDPALGNRFFFEDEGHLRRLDTEQLTHMAAAHGFALEREFYSHQYHGAVDWITRTAPRFAASLADPARAKDAGARRELARLRRRLVPATVLRALLHRLRHFRRDGGGGMKRRAVLLAALATYPIARLVDQRLRRRAEAEWRDRNQDRAGSEMHLYFTRRGPSA